MAPNEPRIVGAREPHSWERNPGGSALQVSMGAMPFIILEFDDGSREEIRVGKSVVHQLSTVMRRRGQSIKPEKLPEETCEIYSRYEREDPI